VLSSKLIIDNWLTKQLCLPSYDLKEPLSYFTTSDIPSGRSFITAKVESRKHSELAHLQEFGFKVITVNVQLLCKRLPVLRSFDLTNVRLVSPTDESAIRRMARESFSYDRFHADSKISSLNADAVKEQWSANYFYGQRGDALFVIEQESRPAGFLLAIDSKEKGFIIDLIAVDRAFQGRGLALSLISYAHNYFFNKHSRAGISVGTQVSNTRSLRLYQKYGFEFSSAHYILHLHTV
jgi:ribosomal protein S18 acetylase RimI-like enzyme